MNWKITEHGKELRLNNEMGLVVFEGEGDLWWYQITADGYGEDDHIISQYHAPTEQGATLAGLEASLALASAMTANATAALAKTKQAVMDADDAALVAPVEPAWLVHDAGHAILHAAVVAGHKCLVSVQPSGHVKWELEPEHDRHPYTWDAPDVETAKIRAAAAALRTPCKRWMVEIPDQTLGQREIKGGTVEVWAVTSEGALYRACEALEIRSFGRAVYGKAMEVRL